MGAQKLESFADQFLTCIARQSESLGLDLDSTPAPAVLTRAAAHSTNSPKAKTKSNPQKSLAFERFAEGDSLDEIAGATGRALSTIAGYLIEWIASESPKSIDPWVNPETYQRIVEAMGTDRRPLLRPIYDSLDGQVSYEQIRAVIAHVQMTTRHPPNEVGSGDYG